ncbi:MAG: adenosine deaminase [Acetivibrio sp.]
MKTQLMPKIELHCHLDGSIPLNTIRKLCLHSGIKLPQQDYKLKKRIEADENCESLEQYLRAFELPLSCLSSEEAFHIAAHDVVSSMAKENVRYAEIRFAPLFSETDTLKAEGIIEAVLDGIRLAEKEDPITVKLLLCGMRHFSEKKNLKTLELAQEFREKGVVGADLAGNEAAYPNDMFDYYFDFAQKKQIPLTIHGGECGNAESVRYAVLHGARRIGHGIAMEKEEEIMELCKKEGIGIELCPKSNLQTKAIGNIKDYPLQKFLDRGLKVSLNTDNRTVTDTTIENEFQLLEEVVQMDASKKVAVMKNAVDTSFATPALKEKLQKELQNWELSNK